MTRLFAIRLNGVVRRCASVPLWTKKQNILPCMSDVANLSASEMSRLCSMMTTSRMSTEQEGFWDQVTDRLIQILQDQCVNDKKATLTATLHVLDRIASSSGSFPPENLHSLLKNVCRLSSSSTISAVDAFIGARSMMLLGWRGDSVLQPHHVKKLSMSNVLSLGLLARSVGDTVVEDISRTGVVSHLRESSFNLLSTSDLVRSCDLLSLGSASDSANSVSILKSIGTELIRRIELGYVSLHTAVALVGYFSGTPPAPIHPQLLQGCYALLLQDRNYKKLSMDEIGKCMQGMVNSEIENIVLSSCLVSEVVERGEISSDSRTMLRILSSVSVSKADFPSDWIHALSVLAVKDPMTLHHLSTTSSSDVSTYATATLNLLYRGMCTGLVQAVVDRAVDRILNQDLAVDLPDMASLMLLVCACRGMACYTVKREENASLSKVHVPLRALEITEKANPALPRKDLNKKRLAKRIVESAVNDVAVNEILENQYSCDAGLESCLLSATIEPKIASLLTAHILKHLTATGPEAVLTRTELREAVTDILSGFQFLDLSRLELNELRLIGKLIDTLFRKLDRERDFAEVAACRPEEDIKSTEDSVRTTLGNLAMNTSRAVVTNSLNRIALVVQ